MEQRLIPEVGKQYGQWQVISDTIKRSTNRKTYWEVRCKCGKETFRSAETLIKGTSKSCKSCSKTSTYHTFAYSYLKRIKSRAEKIKVDFDLTVEYLWDLYEMQDAACALSGLHIRFSNSWASLADQTCSLDRIDSTKGYIQGNVQWVHKDINFMKHTFGQNYFIEMCKKVSSKCG